VETRRDGMGWDGWSLTGCVGWSNLDAAFLLLFLTGCVFSCASDWAGAEGVVGDGIQLVPGRGELIGLSGWVGGGAVALRRPSWMRSMHGRGGRGSRGLAVVPGTDGHRARGRARTRSRTRTT
jgi:hypothetical protein